MSIVQVIGRWRRQSWWLLSGRLLGFDVALVVALAPAVIAAVCCQAFDELYDGRAQIPTFDLRERFDEGDFVGRRKEFVDVGRRRFWWSYLSLHRKRPAILRRRTIRGPQETSHMCCRRLALMRLTPFSYFGRWVCKAERVGNFGLAEAEHEAAHAHAEVDVFVSRVRRYWHVAAPALKGEA